MDYIIVVEFDHFLHHAGFTLVKRKLC